MIKMIVKYLLVKQSSDKDLIIAIVRLTMFLKQFIPTKPNKQVTLLRRLY